MTTDDDEVRQQLQQRESMTQLVNGTSQLMTSPHGWTCDDDDQLQQLVTQCGIDAINTLYQGGTHEYTHVHVGYAQRPTVLHHICMSSHQPCKRAAVLTKIVVEHQFDIVKLSSVPVPSGDGVIKPRFDHTCMTLMEYLCTHGTVVEEIDVFITADMRAASSVPSSDYGILGMNGVNMHYSSHPATYPTLLFRMVSFAWPTMGHGAWSWMPAVLERLIASGINWTAMNNRQESVYDILLAESSHRLGDRASMTERSKRDICIAMLTVLRTVIDGYLTSIQQLLWPLFSHMTTIGTTTTTTTTSGSSHQIIASGGIGHDLSMIVCQYVH